MQLCCCAMYCCAEGTCVPISHYERYIFGITKHANTGLRTKSVYLFWSLRLLLLDCFDSFPNSQLRYLISCFLWSGREKRRWIKCTVGPSKKRGGWGCFIVCLFLVIKKCNTSYWESPVVGCVEGRRGARWFCCSRAFGACLPCKEHLWARAPSALRSCTLGAFGMLGSLEVYCLGKNMCFFCYIK